MDTNAPQAPRRLRARDLENKALLMRLAGASYQSIGDALGVSRQAAHKAVGRALEKTAKEIEEGADKLRAIEIARLDRLYLRMSPLAESGSMGAVDRCLRIMERRARFLGLDAPVKQDVTSNGETITVTLVKDGDES